MPSVSVQVPREVNVSTRYDVQGVPIQSWLLEQSHHVQSFAGRSLEEAWPGVTVAVDSKVG